MKRTILLSATLMLVLVFTACKQQSLAPDGDAMLAEAASFEPTVNLNGSDYDRIVAEPLVQDDDCSEYTEGVLEYYENGQVSATVSFDRRPRDFKPCFRFIYPISYTMPDSSTITGNSRTEVDSLLRAWYIANPNVTIRPRLQYPVQIIFKGGKTVTLQGPHDLKRAYRFCHDERKDKKCFRFVYPISYTMPDSSTLTGNSGAQMDSLLRAWYIAHPNVTAKPRLQFPVQIVFKGGRTVTIHNYHELRRAYAKCKNGGGHGGHCKDQLGERDVVLRKDRDQFSAYDKVIVEPLVKSGDCDFITAGSICFFKDGEWVATIDFGDGTCDDIATKTTSTGVTTFSLKDKKRSN